MCNVHVSLSLFFLLYVDKGLDAEISFDASHGVT